MGAEPIRFPPPQDFKYLRDEEAEKYDGHTWALVDLSKAHADLDQTHSSCPIQRIPM